VQKPNGDVVSYTYDTDGIRVSSTVNGVTTQYLVDKNRDYAQVLEEYQNNNLQAEYVYGLDLISQEQGADKSFYLVDGLGSTRGLTDEGGSQIAAYNYDAFGNLISSTGSTDNNYLFAGEQFDNNLGDYYLRARYYNPAIGRFTKKDIYNGRLKEPITLHKYIYGNGNPAHYTDPSGKSSLAENVAISVLAGILADLILPQPLISATGPGDRPYDPAIERLLLSAVLGIIIVKTLPTLGRLGSILLGRSGSSTRFLYENTLPTRLAQELSDAARWRVSPFGVGSQSFAEIVEQGEPIKWAVTQEGRLLIVPKYANGVIEREVAHTVITNGKPVLAAGEATLAEANGKYILIEITNHSGHYLPSAATTRIGEAAFAENGVITNLAKISTQ